MSELELDLLGSDEVEVPDELVDDVPWVELLEEPVPPVASGDTP